MKVIDCNKCANCDKENDRCKLYGSDPKKAVEMCASKNFGGYRPNCGAKMEIKNEQPSADDRTGAEDVPEEEKAL